MLKTMIVGISLLTVAGCSSAASTWTPVCRQEIACPDGRPVEVVVGYTAPTLGYQDFTVRYYCGGVEVQVDPATCPEVVVRATPDDSSIE